MTVPDPPANGAHILLVLDGKPEWHPYKVSMKQPVEITPEGKYSGIQIQTEKRVS